MTARFDAQPGWRVVPSARLDLTLQSYDHDELDASDVVQQRFVLRTRTANLLVRQAALGPFRDGAWGAALLEKRYAATGPAALTPAADSRAFGVFGFQELALAGDATIQFGARFDRYAIGSHDNVKFGAGIDRVFDALSGSMGISVPLGGGVSASITAARSFRAPTVEELFSGAAHAGTGAVEYGDPQLREERGRALEALLNVRTDRVNGQFAAFVNRISDYIQPSFVRDTVIADVVLPVFVYAQGTATLHGVEGMAELALSRTVALAIRGDYLHASRPDGTALSYMPPPRLGATLRRDDGRFALGGDVHYEFGQSRTGAAGEQPTHAHTILRVDAATRVRFVGRIHSISLRIDNLANTLHREATSRIKEFAPAAGRNIAIGWRTTF